MCPEEHVVEDDGFPCIVCEKLEAERKQDRFDSWLNSQVGSERPATLANQDLIRAAYEDKNKELETLRGELATDIESRNLAFPWKNRIAALKAELVEATVFNNKVACWKREIDGALYAKANAEAQVKALLEALGKSAQIIKSAHDYRPEEPLDEGALPFGLMDYYAMEDLLKKIESLKENAHLENCVWYRTGAGCDCGKGLKENA